MPFTFQPYENRSIGSILGLMDEQGRIQGDTLRANAAAQARASEIGGQAWAGAAGSIANLIGNMPGELQRIKAQSQDTQMRQLQLNQATHEAAGQKAMSTLMQGDQLAPGATGPRQESYLDENGLFDVPKITKALGASGFGDVAPQLAKGAESINTSILQHIDYEQKAAQAKTVMLGDMAAGALRLTQGGMPVDQALDVVTQPGLATQRFKPEELAGVKARLASLPPAQQQAALVTMMNQAAQLDKGETLSEGAERLDRYGRVIASNPKPQPPQRPVVVPPGSTAVNPTTGAPVFSAPDKSPAPKSMQSKSVLLDGKPAEVVFDPADGSWKLNGQVVDPARVRPMPPASLMSGEADAAPELTAGGLDAAAKLYAQTGQLPAMGMGKSAAGVRAKIINRAAELNPDLNVAANKGAYGADTAALQQLTKQREAVGAFEGTAQKNIDQFLKVADKVVDTGIPLLNVPARWAANAGGSADQAAYAAARQVAVSEIAKIVQNPNLTGQLSDSARQEVASFNPQGATLKQTIAVLTLLKQDMANRAKALDDQIAGVKDRIGGSSSATPAVGESFKVGGFTVKVK